MPYIRLQTGRNGRLVHTLLVVMMPAAKIMEKCWIRRHSLSIYVLNRLFVLCRFLQYLPVCYVLRC